MVGYGSARLCLSLLDVGGRPSFFRDFWQGDRRSRASAFWMDLFDAIKEMVSLLSSRSGSNGACDKWHPPPSGRLKCNMDGACFMEQNRRQTGMALRDSNGTMIQYMMRAEVGCLDAKVCEALALYATVLQLVAMQS
ncbi:hypothetical protein LINPERHAP1_LOCUS7962 [Linum perenne]